MKLSVESAQHVNWEGIAAELTAKAGENIKNAIKEAQSAFSQLQSGGRKTIKVNVATITVSKPKE